MKNIIFIPILLLANAVSYAQLLSDSNINVQTQPGVVIINKTTDSIPQKNTTVSPLINPEIETYTEQFEEQIYKPIPAKSVKKPLVDKNQPWFDSAFWDTTKVATLSNTINSTNKRVYIDANLIKKRKRTKNIFFLLMTVLLSMLLIIVIQLYPSKHRLYKLSYLSRIRFKDALEEGLGYTLGLLVQITVSVLAFTLFFTSISAYIPTPIFPYSLSETILYSALFFGLILFLDILFIVIYFYAFDKNKIIKPLIHLQVSVDYAFSLILFPLSLILYYNYTRFSLDTMWYLLLFPIILWWFVKLLKSIYLIKSETNIVDFYDLLYFCTFKFLPSLILIKWLWV